MPLERGIYQIISARDLEKPLHHYVGRYPIEDLSLLPKHIYNLPPGVRPPYPHWLVEPHKDGTYILRALGAKTGPGEKDLVYAFLIDDMAPGPLEWKVHPVESTKNPNDYIVVLPKDEGKGWTLGEKTHNGELIEVKPIRATKSLPPQYPPDQVFNFLRIDRQE